MKNPASYMSYKLAESWKARKKWKPETNLIGTEHHISLEQDKCFSAFFLFSNKQKTHTQICSKPAAGSGKQHNKTITSDKFF